MLDRREAGAQALSTSIDALKSLLVETTPQQADALVGLGRVLNAAGKPADATTALVAAERFWIEAAPSSRWRGEAALWLSQAYSAAGESAAARAAARRAEGTLGRSALPGDKALLASLHRR